MEFPVEPVERCADVVNFADAVVVLALAQARAAEIETQHRISKAVERLHGVEDDFVMQRAAKQWMGMANHCGVGRVLCASIEKGFQPAGDGWAGGAFYDPRSGMTYKGSVDPAGPDRIKVTGCIIVPICSSRFWTRVK